MQQNQQLNQFTVDWQKSDIAIDVSKLPGYAANDVDVETFRRDGVVLLRGVFSDWVDTLRSGLQRNLDDPQRFAFPCESNPEGEPGRFFDSYCNWQLIPEYLDFVAFLRRIGRGSVHEQRTGPVFPRTRLLESTRHASRYPVAPGLALLLCRRLQDRKRLCFARPGRRRCRGTICQGIAPLESTLLSAHV